MEGFYIILQNDKRKHYHRIAILLLVFNLAWFIYLWAFSADKKMRFIGTATTIILLANVIIQYLLTRMKKKWYYFQEISFMVIAIAWLNIGLWWMALLHFCISLIYDYVTKTPEVFVSEKYIEYPALFRRKINWTDCINVILKDGLFTIDLKNNHIIQQYVDQRQTTANEKDFNDFCREKLEESLKV